MERSPGSGLSFAKRIYFPRTIGLGIGFFCVAAVFWNEPKPLWAWFLLVANGFVWPHLAFQWARLSRQPYRAEYRNLLCDSLCGGFWVAAMQFNALPSVTILSMMAMNNIAAGGLRFFLAGSLSQVLGALLGMLAFGAHFSPQTSPAELYTCLPMLVFYPLALGMVSYRLAIKLAEHKQVLRAVSRTDSLTHLFNHGHWKDLLQREFDHCRRDSRSACVALIDIDHFKDINDRLGHLVGDSVLRLLSEHLQRNLREGDLAGRYGGDEFCVILPHTSLERAGEIMECIRRSLGQVQAQSLPAVRFTLSIGLAGYDLEHSSASQWLQLADEALYRAKTQGRDQVASGC